MNATPAAYRPYVPGTVVQLQAVVVSQAMIDGVDTLVLQLQHVKPDGTANGQVFNQAHIAQNRAGYQSPTDSFTFTPAAA